MPRSVLSVATPLACALSSQRLLLISQSNDSDSHTNFQQAVEVVDRDGIEVFSAHYSSYAMS